VLVHQIRVELHCRQAHDLSKILFYEMNPCHGGENALEVEKMQKNIYDLDDDPEGWDCGGGGQTTGGAGSLSGRPCTA
jgi:hypothetical protein